MTNIDNVMFKYMKKIVYDEQKPFSFLDFLKFDDDGVIYTLKHGTIRNKFSQFTKEKRIEFCYKDRIAFYSLPGKKFGRDKLMTSDHMDIINYNDDLQSLRRTIRKHPIYGIISSQRFKRNSAHDLHFTFKSKGLYNYLLAIDYFKDRMNHRSKSISFGYFKIEKYLTIKVRVQDTDTVNVTINCSLNPIILDPDGVMRLDGALTRIEERLAKVVNDPNNKTFNAEYNTSDIKIPNRDEWKIVLWHLGKDSVTEYSGEKFHCSWRKAKNLFIRVYTKELKLNGRKNNIVRIEIQENPDILFKQLLIDFIRKDKDMIIQNTEGVYKFNNVCK